MKKYVVFLLLFLPMVSFGAPSVRMLGNQPALSAAISSGSKVTPVKSSAENAAASTARIGTLSAKAKTSNLSSANSIKSSSRFPVIQPAYSYNSVSTPQTGGSSGGSYAPSHVNVDEIVSAVTQNIDGRYYTKAEVYNNSDFVEAVQDVVEDVDDPRIDAIRVRTAAQGSPRSYWESQGLSLPSGYVYMWVEDNN